MTWEVIVLPEALGDLDEIISWTSERSPEGAARLLAAFERELGKLSSLAHVLPRAPEGQTVSRQIRQLFFQTRRGRRYRALYEIRGNQVLVLHVRGPRQNLLTDDELRGGDLPENTDA